MHYIRRAPIGKARRRVR